MFVVREFVQECGRQTRELLRESSFAERGETESFLRERFKALLSDQRNWPGVWSISFENGRYTLDNVDGDFFCGSLAIEETS